MKEKRQEISLKSGAERWTEGSAFDKMVRTFKDRTGDDPEAYQKIRQLAMGDEKVIPEEMRGRFDRKKLTNTQKWGMRLVQLAAQEVVLEREGESAFPDEKGFPMGIGTKIGPEADRLIDGINLFYDGHPTLVINPNTGMSLWMHKVDDIIALLPSKKVLVGAGVTGLLSLVLAACGGQEGQSAATTTPTGESTKPVAALVTPTETAVIPPTATTAPTETAAHTETATPTETAEPTVTQETPAGVATRSEFYREERTYSYVEVDGVKYVMDEYNKGLIQKYVEGQGWVDTSWEEKAGHLVPWDDEHKIDYKLIETSANSPSGEIKMVNVPVYFTGFSVTEVVKIPGTDLETKARRDYLVTRSQDGGIIVFDNLSGEFSGTARSLKMRFVKEGGTGRSVDQNGRVETYRALGLFWGTYVDLDDVIEVMDRYGVTMVGARALTSFEEGNWEKRINYLETVTCDPSDPKPADCDAAMFREFRQNEEFPLVVDARDVRTGMAQGIIDLKIFSHEFGIDISVDNLEDAVIQKMLTELEAMKPPKP